MSRAPTGRPRLDGTSLRIWQSLLVGSVIVCHFGARAHEFYFYTANATPDQVVPAPDQPPPGVRADLEMRFDGDEHSGGPLAVYAIRLHGLDLDGEQTPAIDDDVQAIRFRMAAAGANGPHALNIFAGPGSGFQQDDAELFIDPANGLVEGIWNNQDQVFSGPGGTRLDSDSVGVTAAARDLIEGTLYLEITTAGYPEGLLRGQVIGAESLKVPRYFGTGDFQLTVVSTSPRRIRVETTTDWNLWTPFTNLTAGVQVVRLIDGPAAEPGWKFYRIDESSVLFPTIAEQPEDAAAIAGGSVSFSVAVEGTPPFYSQWFHNGQPLSGATNLQLTLGDLNGSHAGTYHVLVSNIVARVTSEPATLSLLP